MFFWFSPPNGKCEWIELKDFVEFYNIKFGTKYSLSRCLDLEDRTNPQPEILLEAQDGKPMVIERKAIVWPPKFAQYFNTDDEFGSTFITSMNQEIKTGVYVLEVQANSLNGSKQFIQGLPSQIVDEILANQQMLDQSGNLSSDAPIPWRFKRLTRMEYDDDTPENGVGIRFYSPIDLGGTNFAEELEKAHQILKTYLRRVLKGVDAKFANYNHCVKVLVLEPYGDDLSLPEDFIDNVFSELEVPNPIDEIWLAEPEFVGEYDWVKSYRQLRVEGSQV
ncbi:MAG: hypothetical protein P4L59_21970 [Desulfosporosinus sp.]|nr:hypothetical protein [Desulfosporosinus sp.]